ncbi:ABC transporter [Mycobacteroides abscessus subsp. abscessus]|nr:ABC transporter [Mycobacteroides abscessus subsp. abscessus]
MPSKKISEQNSLQNAEDNPRFSLIPPGFRYPKWRFILPFITETISGTALVFMPALVARIIELFTIGDVQQAWIDITGLCLLVLFLSLNEKIGWGTCFRTIVMLERDWKLYAGSLVPRSSQAGDPGAIVAVINKDTRNVANTLQPLNQAFSSFAIAFFGTIQLWLLSPLLAVSGLGGMILTIVLLTRISKILEQRAEIFRDKIGISTSKASDIATSIRTIVGLGAGQTMLGRYRTSALDVRKAQLAYERVHSWQGAARVFLIGCTTTVTIALALRGHSLNGTWITSIDPSQLVTVSGVLAMMVGPIWAVEMFLLIYRDAKVAHRRIVGVEKRSEPTASLASQSHEHAGSSQTLPASFAQLRLTAETRRVVYINPRSVGLTAQEYAETLVEYLRVNSDNREEILLSEPNPMIFAGTLEDHLTTGAPGQAIDEREEYLKLTDSLEIAHRLGGENPADYWLAEISAEGTNLSGGQRQRLALARAYAQKKPVLVLTEPVNSVDEPSQQFIFNQLEKCAGYPGVLEHLREVYIISTTMEVDRRIARANQRQGE